MSEKDVETGSIRSLPETHRYEDPSSKLWSAYVAEANVYDRALVESWKGDMDGILFFAGLFSASVTAFIVESYKMLKPDSGDMTVTLLMQISRQLNTSSNGLHTEDMGRPTLGKFQATSSAIRVNAFWFLSLCFGLACALAATLVEQWARNYMQGIERRPAPHKKARIRAFLYEGVESYGMSNVVEGIPTLLHIAVFLFFAGLVEFLFPIHPGIAWLVLVIVFVCAGLYGVITILPTIRRQCPYRTPLSGICWRVFQALGLIRYIDTNGEYARIEGSIAQGQEILATRILPGQYQRDLRALKWTVEMLTDDNEFEAFLEGVRIYLSDPTSPVIRDLMLDPDINLIDRIARLLATCTQSGALPEDSRCRRALTSMETVCALVKVVDTVRWTSKWTSLDSFGIILGQSLKRLERDNSAAISDIAAVTIKCVVDKLHQDIITIIQRRDLWNISDKPSTFIWNSTNAALNTLNSMGALDSIIEMIPGLMISIPSSCVIAEHSVLLCIALNCGLSHIPTLLKTCSQLGASGSVRRVRAIACMRAICHAAAVFQAWNVSTSRSLAAIKKDIILDIVPYVTLTAARAACHLQCDIVDTMGGISAHRTNGKAGKLPSGLTSRVAQCYGAITELGLLDPCHDGDAGSDVNLLQHMQLGIITDLPELHEQDLWQKLLQQSVEEAERQLELIPLEEQKSLDNFELRTSAFKIHPPQPIPRHLKLIVNRGHIAVLIHLLQTMAHSPSFYTSDEVDFALETLEFVTSNLSARFSSPPVQKLLVQLIGEIIEKISLPDYSKLPHELKWRTVDPLLAMIGTIGDADSIADAKKLMHHYLGTVQFGEAATAALQKLEDTLPLALLSE